MKTCMLSWCSLQNRSHIVYRATNDQRSCRIKCFIFSLSRKWCSCIVVGAEGGGGGRGLAKPNDSSPPTNALPRAHFDRSDTTACFDAITSGPSTPSHPRRPLYKLLPTTHHLGRVCATSHASSDALHLRSCAGMPPQCALCGFTGSRQCSS